MKKEEMLRRFTAIAHKASGSFLIRVPKRDADMLGIKDRDELEVWLQRTGEVIPILRKDKSMKWKSIHFEDDLNKEMKDNRVLPNVREIEKDLQGGITKEVADEVEEFLGGNINESAIQEQP